MTQVRYELYSDVGGRNENEDSAGVQRKTLSGKYLFVVADGLGGHGGGKAASSAVVSSVREKWRGEVSAEEWKRLFAVSHEEVLRIQTKSCRMKSTAVGLMIDKQKIAWGHIGDSRLYQFYDGKLVFQTRDHSASQLAVMMGEIEPKDIRFHEARNQVLRALGQSDIPKSDCSERTLETGEYAFLLCTDGFWEYITEDEMESTLKNSVSPEQWLGAMRNIIQGRFQANNDNNTAITVFVKNR